MSLSISGRSLVHREPIPLSATGDRYGPWRMWSRTGSRRPRRHPECHRARSDGQRPYGRSRAWVLSLGSWCLLGFGQHALREPAPARLQSSLSRSPASPQPIACASTSTTKFRPGALSRTHQGARRRTASSFTSSGSPLASTAATAWDGSKVPAAPTKSSSRATKSSLHRNDPVHILPTAVRCTASFGMPSRVRTTTRTRDPQQHPSTGGVKPVAASDAHEAAYQFARLR